MNNARPKSLYGSHAAVVSGHHLATQAGADCLRHGGSLADAAITASAVLAVALPHASSLGGCGMLLYFDRANGKVLGLNGSGRAPLQVQPEHFADGMPQRGVRAAVVPTLVRLHERYGRQDWSQLFAPARALAEQGIAVPEELARNLARNLSAAGHGALTEQPGFADFFLPQENSGQPLAAADRLVQPALAQVLHAIAQQGEAGFYAGHAARALVQFSQRHGGFFTQEDFAAARADWVQPWSCRLGPTTVHTLPPNSVGGLMLRQLEVWRLRQVARQEAQQQARQSGGGNTAQGLDTMAADMAADIENAMAIIRQGQPRLGDAGRTSITPDDIGLGSGGLLNAASGAPAFLNGIRSAHGDTAGFVAMDEHGNALALLQSVFQPFGSGAVDPITGILLNNRMFDFAHLHGQPNSVGAGLRPAHTLNPWLITQTLTQTRTQASDIHATGSCIYLAGVSPGGISQTTTGFQLVRQALAGGLTAPVPTLGQIVSAPRWSLSRAGEVLLEAGMPAALARTLRTRGHTVVENSDHEFYFGSAKLLRRTTRGWLEAAADTRRQATALAW